MRKKILITIIIPVYNVEVYLSKCLQSIVEDAVCSSGQVEVIMIDDGSTDASARIAESFSAEHHFATLVRQANGGVASARNVGIRQAHGEWLYFVDSDDWLTEDALSVLMHKCQQYSNADILLFDAWQDTPQERKNWEHFSKEYVWKEDGAIKSLQRGMLYFPFPSELEKSEVPLAAPWDKLYRRDFIMRNHLQFRENLHVLDDMVFNIEAFGAAGEIVYLKEKIYHYRYVEDSITNSYKKDRVDRDREVWSYVERYVKTKEIEWTPAEKEQFIQAFYCRIVKSFSICCRLQFFNMANKQRLLEKIRYVKGVWREAPYREAFEKVRLHNLEWRLKVVAVFGRMHWGSGIYLLHLAENGMRRHVGG